MQSSALAVVTAGVSTTWGLRGYELPVVHLGQANSVAQLIAVDNPGHGFAGLNPACDVAFCIKC